MLFDVVLSIVLTILVYQGCQFIQQKLNMVWLNPMLLSIVIIIPAMIYFNVSFEQYMQGGQWLNNLLEPAVVALGFPLYQQLNMIKKQWKPISLLLLFSSTVAVVVSYFISLLLISDRGLAVSMALKLISTPIALELSTMFGGINALTALAIIIAGLVGAVGGVPWLNFIGVIDKSAQGLAVGSGSHVLGTATMSKECSYRGAYGALALIFCGLFTAIVSPLILK